MSRPRAKKSGDYPEAEERETVDRKTIHIGNKRVLCVTYEKKKSINLFIGGHETWCIHAELIKDGNKFKPRGYLIKIRYDTLCSLDHNFTRGHDTRMLLQWFIRYIHDIYSDVKELSFNDISIQTCDNQTDVSLAVMTYLYSGITWYQKTFGAVLSEESKSVFELYQKKLEDAKKISWDDMKDTIRNRELLPYTEEELEGQYEAASTWKKFFEPIHRTVGMSAFCNFVSGWLDKFILKYFNNLQGIIYLLPIHPIPVSYTVKEYSRGGRRFTRKNLTRSAKDYR